MSEQMDLEENQLGLDFLSGKVFRGEMELMSVEELLFLVGSAVRYDQMFPIQQSGEFVAEIREMVGLGFTREQFEEVKKMWASGEFVESEDDM